MYVHILKKVYHVLLILLVLCAVGFAAQAMKKTEEWDERYSVFIEAVENDKNFIIFTVLDDLELVQELSVEDKKYALCCAVLKNNEKVINAMCESIEFMKGLDTYCREWSTKEFQLPPLRNDCLRFVFEEAIRNNRDSIILFVLKKTELVKGLPAKTRKSSFAWAMLNRNQKIVLNMLENPDYIDAWDTSCRELFLESAALNGLKNIVRKMFCNKKYMDGISQDCKTKVRDILLKNGNYSGALSIYLKK